MIPHKAYKNGTIYLSGSMEWAPDGQLGGTWRKIVAQKLKGLEYFPIDITHLDRAYSKEYGELYRLFDKEQLLQFKSNIRRHFIYTDLELVINDSDAVIALYDEGVRRGAGTMSEIATAYANDIPVFLVSAYDDPLKEIPGWMIAQSTKLFTSFDELYEYLGSLPEGILKRDAYGNHSSGNNYLCSLCGDPFEKEKHHFVSKISPLYCKCCVDSVGKTYENLEDRYKFFLEFMEAEALKESEGR